MTYLHAEVCTLLVFEYAHTGAYPTAQASNALGFKNPPGGDV